MNKRTKSSNNLISAYRLADCELELDDLKGRV